MSWSSLDLSPGAQLTRTSHPGLYFQWELCPKPPVFVRCGKNPACSAVTHGFSRTDSNLECFQTTFNLVDRERRALGLLCRRETAGLVLSRWLLTQIFKGKVTAGTVCVTFVHGLMGLGSVWKTNFPRSESAQNKHAWSHGCCLLPNIVPVLFKSGFPNACLKENT